MGHSFLNSSSAGAGGWEVPMARRSVKHLTLRRLESCGELAGPLLLLTNDIILRGQDDPSASARAAVIHRHTASLREAARSAASLRHSEDGILQDDPSAPFLALPADFVGPTKVESSFLRFPLPSRTPTPLGSAYAGSSGLNRSRSFNLSSSTASLEPLRWPAGSPARAAAPRPPRPLSSGWAPPAGWAEGLQRSHTPASALHRSASSYRSIDQRHPRPPPLISGQAAVSQRLSLMRTAGFTASASLAALRNST